MGFNACVYSPVDTLAGFKHTWHMKIAWLTLN